MRNGMMRLRGKREGGSTLRGEGLLSRHMLLRVMGLMKGLRPLSNI